MQLTMTPKYPEDTGAETITVKADSIGELIFKMIEENIRIYGKEVLGFACVLEGLAAIASGDNEFSHYDFSCPEEAFTLTLKD